MGMGTHLDHVSVHIVNTTATETVLTVPKGYSFHIEYIRIMNRTGTNKNIDLLHNKNHDGYSETLYILDDKTIATKDEYELPDIFLVMYGNDGGVDTLSIAQDGSSTFDIIVSGSLQKITSILDITG